MVEVSMQEAVANLMRCQLSHRERDRERPVPRRGNRTLAPTDLYPCAGGGPNDYLYIMVVTSRMWDAGGLGVLLWMAMLGAAAWAIYSVWRAYRTY